MGKKQKTSRRTAVMAMAGLAGLPSFAATGKLPNSTMDGDKATLTKEDFGELRVYFDGPTDQLKAMTAGSLMLKPGMQPHPPHQHPEEEMMVIAGDCRGGKKIPRRSRFDDVLRRRQAARHFEYGQNAAAVLLL